MSQKHHVNPPLNIYKKIALSFIILALVLIGVIFYFSISYAYITVYPKKELVKTDYNFVVVYDAKAANEVQGIFPGKVVEQTLEGEKLMITTGTKTLAGDVVGRVKLTNNLAKNQALVATTRLLTADNLLFRLKTAVNIPAKGSVEAAVYPDDPTKPLVKAGVKFTIPGLSSALQSQVYAESITDFAASGQTVKAISQEEVDKAFSDYAEELAQQVFTAEDGPKTKILSKEILEKSLDRKIGDEILNYRIKLKIKVSGVIFDDKGVKEYARKTLENLISADKQLVSTDADTMIYEISKVDSQNKLAQLKSTISGEAMIGLNNPILEREKLVKLKADEIIAYLQNFEQIEKVEIKFFPSWAKKMPYFQDHIIIKIVQ